MRDSNIKLVISTKCELLVSPMENLYDPGFVYLEFLVSDHIDTLSTLTISEAPEYFRQPLNQDGLYMYYRLKVPTKKILEGDLDTRLYYDEDVQELMIGNEEVVTSEQLENIVDDDFPHTTYKLAGEIIEEPIFSICRISECLANSQRQYIFEELQIGQNCKNNSNKLNRDFLFSTVFILKFLIRQQRYEEAVKILESVNQCSEICDKTYTATKRRCGCN